MDSDSGTISRTSAIVADLVAGVAHDRNSIASRYGMAVAAADRYVRALSQVPGVVTERQGRRRVVRFEIGDAVPRPSHAAAVAACWAAGIADVFSGSEYEQGVRDALEYVAGRARRSGDFTHVSRKFLFVSQGGESSLPESAPMLRDLVDAVLHSRYAAVRYADFNGDEKSFRIQPLSVAIYQHQIYVIGIGHKNTPYPYRLSRFLSVALSNDTFEYPPRAVYDPSQIFRESFGIFITDSNPVAEVRVRLAPKWRFHCRTHRWHVSQRVEERPDCVVVSIVARVCWELKAWILGFGPDAVVLDPPELVAEMRHAVVAMGRAYERDGTARKRRVGPKRADESPRRRRSRAS